MAIRVLPDGLSLDGQRLPLFSGALQYWRLEREFWGPILDSIKEMGFGVVETYIPWDVHELEKGRFDFGDVDPKNDLPAFLDMCCERDLKVLVRPGPHINAELRDFGYPRRVLADPEVQAKTAQGTLALYHFPLKPFPAPSYASGKLFEEYESYVAALAPILAERIYPNGPIVAIQADNELAYFFRITAYDLDYSRSAIQQYRGFLSGRYGSIEALNQAYRASYRSFDELMPPTEFHGDSPEELPFYLDWARYKEHQLIEALRTLKEIFARHGLGALPTYQNYPGPYTNVPGEISYRTPFSVARTEQYIDVVGVDSYPLKEDYEAVKQSVQYVVGTSRLPYIPEFGAGAVSWRRPPMIEEHEFATLTLLMHGIKAINFFMIVDRDRWLGSPITINNRRREPEFGLYRRFNRLIDDIGYLDLQRESQALLLANRDCERLASATALLPIPSRTLLNFKVAELYLSEQELGLGDRIPMDHFLLWKHLYAGMTRAGFCFDLSDTDALTTERLAKYPVVIVPTFSFMSPDSQDALRAYAEGGGVVVMGPRAPSLDDSMFPHKGLAQHLRQPVARAESCSVEGRIAARQVDLFDTQPLLEADGRAAAYAVPLGKGGIIHFGFLPGSRDEGAAADLVRSLLAAAGVEPSSLSSNPRVEVVRHAGQGRSVLFAANPTAERQSADLSLESDARLRDCWGEDHRSHARIHQVELAPYTIKIWEVLA